MKRKRKTQEEEEEDHKNMEHKEYNAIFGSCTQKYYRVMPFRK